jgi:hypothetical protein
MNSDQHNKLHAFFSRFYLIYLGLLPALATFAVLWGYGYPWLLCLFLGGVAAVGVYLAVVMSYTPVPPSLPWLVLALLDGPLFVLISMQGNFHPLAFAIEGFLIDGSAIWISILFLAFVSPLPTREQRIASIVIMMVILGLICSLFWPYWQDYLWGNWQRIFWLLAGIVQATWLNYGRFERAEVRRQEQDGGILFIVGLLMIWLIGMIVGANLHEAGVAIPY